MVDGGSGMAGVAGVVESDGGDVTRFFNCNVGLPGDLLALLVALLGVMLFVCAVDANVGVC